MIDFLRIGLAILLPPLAVFTKVGTHLHFWLNLLLMMVGYVPGLVHALWLVLRR